MVERAFGLAAYVSVYAIATTVCAVGVGRALQIDDNDTRRGLLGLLIGSGGWALFQTAFLIAPTYNTAYILYSISLVVGLSSVFAWLYFASAFTGRTLHRSRTWRVAGVATYLGIVVLKVTNPLHGYYFTISRASDPFVHFTVVHEVIHWVVTGGSYVAASIGFFILFEAFTNADYNTRPLAVLSILTAVPVGLDLLGYTTQAVLEINYEPLGVAVFAAGTLFVFRDQFFIIDAPDTTRKPLLYFDANDRLREYNTHAERVYPDLASRRGQLLSEAFPAINKAAQTERSTITVGEGTEAAYYLVTDQTISRQGPHNGRVIYLTDVTTAEQRRRELARHNEQLNEISDGLRHELLNTLNIMQGWIYQAEQGLETDEQAEVRNALETAATTGDRVVGIIEDFVSLTQYGTTINERELVDITDASVTAQDIDNTGVSVLVTTGGEVLANRGRLIQLIASAAEFAAKNNATSLAVGMTDDMLTLTDNGDPINDKTDPTDYFNLDAAVPTSEAGLALPKLRVIARLHGWRVSISEEYDSGVQIIISGVDTPREPDTLAPVPTLADETASFPPAEAIATESGSDEQDDVDTKRATHSTLNPQLLGERVVHKPNKNAVDD